MGGAKGKKKQKARQKQQQHQQKLAQDVANRNNNPQVVRQPLKQKSGRGRGRGRGAQGRGRGAEPFSHSRKKDTQRGAIILSAPVEQVPEEGLARHQEIVHAHDEAVMAIVMTGEAVYSASRDKKIKRWKPQPSPIQPGRFELHREVEIHLPEPCWCLAVVGEWLFAGLGDGQIMGWSKAGSTAVLKEGGHKKRVAALLLHEHVLISGGHDTTVKMWQAGQGPQPFVCTHSVSDSLPGAVQCLQVLGNKLWVGGTSGVVLVELTTLRAEKQLLPKKFVAGFLLFEGHMIVAYADGSCIIFDPEGNQKMEQQPLPQGAVIGMVGLESGPRVLLGHSKGQVSSIGLPMFDCKKAWQAFEKCKVMSMCTAGHDGIFLLGGENGNLQLWQRREVVPPAGLVPPAGMVPAPGAPMPIAQMPPVC